MHCVWLVLRSVPPAAAAAAVVVAAALPRVETVGPEASVEASVVTVTNRRELAVVVPPPEGVSQKLEPEAMVGRGPPLRASLNGVVPM